MATTTGHLLSGGMPVPDDLAARLRDVRERLDAHDRQRQALIEERDALVIEARDAGASLRDVAELLGLTHPAVIKIERRHED